MSNKNTNKVLNEKEKVEKTVEMETVSKEKILNVIDTTLAKYKGKVVLAMSEVMDIINVITAAIKE